MAYCANCGSKIEDGYDFCPECGKEICNTTKQEAGSKFKYDDGKYKICRKCGEKMLEDAFYCLACGNTFDSLETDWEGARKRVLNTGKTYKRPIDISVGVWKNKWISLVLCIFLGVFGVHRFYEEKKITGLIYLFTFGILGIGWFFDMVLIATKTNPYRVK